MKLLISTNNPGKMGEFLALFQHEEIELTTPAEIGLDLSIQETGSTYAENAALKARGFSKASGLWTLADDSGLEVDALGGLPGLHSARFLEKPDATDAERRQRLIHSLEGKLKPWTARFRCVIALVSPDSEITYTEGTCEGEVISEERGSNGFGYDPIFLIPEFGKTMAELSLPEKNLISHRAVAARKVLHYMERLLEIE